MQTLTAAFEKPLAEHTACPFWFWNGDMHPDELVRQIHLMHEKGIHAFVLHARHGLMIEYLSEEWFDRCRLAIEEAARLGIKVWLYDEDNWPSGYAGGRVLARDPSYIAQNLSPERHYVQGPTAFQLDLDQPTEVRAVLATRIAKVRPVPPNPLAFNKMEDKPSLWADTSRYDHVYADEEPRPLSPEGTALTWEVPKGRWCVMIIRQRPTNWIAAYSDCYYPDLINDAAVDAFIEETHAQYYRRFKNHFGETILGFFVDEPGFYNNVWDRNVGSITWTHDLAREFRERRGYELLPWLPALWSDLGNRSEQVRFDYWQTISELLDERFFGKLAQWCADHGVMLTGHLNCEEWLFTATRMSASPFQALKPFHVPGVDKIDEVTEKMAEKLVASIAHANGRHRVLSETFANIGWKLAPPYMKQIIDYQYVRGVNWLASHGFYFSIEDYRKYECPPSEFFQNPWWNHSKPLWDYVSRLSAVLSRGTHVAPIALYYPIEQAWTHVTPESPGTLVEWPSEPWQLPDPHLPVQHADLSMIRLGLCLLDNQYDFDLVDHSVLERATVNDSRLHANQEQFDVTIVPAVKVLTSGALQCLLGLARAGGTVLFVDKLPLRTVCGTVPEGWPAVRGRLEQLKLPGFVELGLGRLGFVPQGIQAVVGLLRTVIRPDVEVKIAPGDDRILSFQENRNGMLRETRFRPLSHALKYHRRRMDSADVYFVVNESDQSFTASLGLAGRGIVEEWLPHTGDRQPLSAATSDHERVTLTLHFAPWQSHLLILTAGAPVDVPAEAARVTWVQDLEDWRCQVGDFEWRGELASWHELGLAWHSGQGTYRTSFQLPEAPRPGERILLDLGCVFETAQVTVNGTALRPMPWGPYRADITECVHGDDNELVVVVANTNTNAFEKRERPSGLLGPVRLTSLGSKKR
ncbi:MAG: glycosyl hydrolase [Chloroflexota bacterium]|nr:glycosyl hydrolase [Chloroflexota bacterium]